ncbi:MAG: hypothetical protein KKB51_20975 [Candidatus Riflebacteria bacterium]|nr:hypothetical protein [Candidatus Riflebacteria bacterium]
MRSGYAWFWCCALLISICLCTAATGKISDDGRRAVERLRLRHQDAEAEPGRLGMRELAEQLRKKHEKVEAPQKAEPLATTVPAVTAEAVSPVEAPENADGHFSTGRHRRNAKPKHTG